MNDLNEQASGSSEDRTLAMITHLSAIVFGFIVPLIIWLINKDKPEKEFLTDQSKEALNFTISLFIVYIVLMVLSFVTFGLAGLLSPVIWIVSVVFFIIAGLKAKDGVRYRYPLTLRLIA
ncbi:DUF4870 domain-containing protein [Lysobacter sp. Root690]|uniref:DUF4870 domain-containing protein n=1 Tax=Lysobacter sp. Root690 TaxID=1736588 RepID=UPI0006FF5B49|nr:DUF4870 domain-containing protein [Lysobacter sp. Root690]KRB08909.1 hypothetical protein ASD86_06400 [Lysobacter sp. Root690]